MRRRGRNLNAAVSPIAAVDSAMTSPTMRTFTESTGRHHTPISRAKLGKDHGTDIILDFVGQRHPDQHPWFIDRLLGARRRSVTGTSAREQGPNSATHPGFRPWRSQGWDRENHPVSSPLLYAQQPDELAQPTVVKVMHETTQWWYKRGVAGFRRTAVDTPSRIQTARTTRSCLEPTSRTIPTPRTRQHNLPRHHETAGLRKAADEYDAVLIGETWKRHV